MQNATGQHVISIENRVWEISPQPMQDMRDLQEDLLQRGFDGYVYRGMSKPTGLQRKLFTGMFYRSASTGDFVNVLAN